MQHIFTVKIESENLRKAVESRLFTMLDSEFLNYWIGHEVEPVASSTRASSPPEASSTPEAQPPPPVPAPAPSLEYILRQFRDLSQAMLGMCDCEKPDKEARGAALAEWICMRDQLDIHLEHSKP